MKWPLRILGILLKCPKAWTYLQKSSQAHQLVAFLVTSRLIISSQWINKSEQIPCDSSVGIVTRIWKGKLANHRSIPMGAGQNYLLQNAQSSSGAQPVSYSMGNGGHCHRRKAVRTWSWPLTSIQCRGYEWLELYLYFCTFLHGVHT
jgi:hypothetical protein